MQPVDFKWLMFSFAFSVYLRTACLRSLYHSTCSANASAFPWLFLKQHKYWPLNKTHCLNEQLTPCNSIPLEKLVKKFPTLSEIQMIHFHVYNNRKLGPILNHIKPVYAISVFRLYLPFSQLRLILPSGLFASVSLPIPSLIGSPKQ